MAEMWPYIRYEKMSVVNRPGRRNNVTWNTAVKTTTTANAPRTAATPTSISRMAAR